VLAVAIEAIAVSINRLTTIRTAVATIVAVAAGYWSITGLLPRQTNIDKIATTLKQSTSPQDVVVFAPYYYAISLKRYWPETNRYTTLPAIEDFSIHRYDLVRKAMQQDQTEITAPLMSRIKEALKSGHKLWWVGEFDVLNPGEPIPRLPIYTGQPELTDSHYLSVWVFQISQVLQQHAGNFEPIEVSHPGEIAEEEDLRIYCFSGWND
jgi:hypothetical protein